MRSARNLPGHQGVRGKYAQCKWDNSKTAGPFNGKISQETLDCGVMFKSEWGSVQIMIELAFIKPFAYNDPETGDKIEISQSQIFTRSCR